MPYPGVPNNIVNGTLEDAVPVMGNFNSLANALNTGQMAGITNAALAPGVFPNITGAGAGVTGQFLTSAGAGLPWSYTTVGSGLAVVAGTLSAPRQGILGESFGPGSYTVNIISSNIKVTLIGAGGGGDATFPGGAGGVVIAWLTGLTVGNTLTLDVGIGGAPTSFGGQTQLSSGSQIITSVTAGGGGPGSGSDGVAGATAGGSLSLGNFQLKVGTPPAQYAALLMSNFGAGTVSNGIGGLAIVEQ